MLHRFLWENDHEPSVHQPFQSPPKYDINACIKPSIEYNLSQQQLMFLLWQNLLYCSRQMEWMMGVTWWKEDETYTTVTMVFKKANKHGVKKVGNPKPRDEVEKIETQFKITKKTDRAASCRQGVCERLANQPLIEPQTVKGKETGWDWNDTRTRSVTPTDTEIDPNKRPQMNDKRPEKWLLNKEKQDRGLL
jgi:hypothetical protein